MQILLLVLYLAFISLGLPDQILGVAWPDMRYNFSKPLDFAGILIFITTLFTVVASFLSGYFAKKFNIASILIASCAMTAFALLGYGLSSSWIFIVLFSVILGTGAGTIDAVLNDYVAKNYSSKHMNWLHGFWGIGATLGPLIMTASIAFAHSWRFGYILIAVLQILLLIFFIATKNQWGQAETKTVQPHRQKQNLFGVAPILSALFFLVYVCLETSMGLWFYSVLVEYRGVAKGIAGSWIVCYWASLTIGRFLIGFVSNKIFCSKIITAGIVCALFSLILALFNNPHSTLCALIFAGLAFSGLYPCMMSETASRFDSKTASVLTGYQVGMAGIGFAVLTPLVGVIIAKTSMLYFVPIMIILCFVLLVFDFLIVTKLKKKL